jgi:predicted O-linked N-acetylglucosamine transferase (SPINDLY family)
MQEMDIYLDTPAFSGFTTAWQALHCGLPVVTMEGEFLRQRLAAGLMRRVGLTETIAQSYDEYVALAVELANDSDKRQGLRLKMSSVAGVADEDLSVIRTLERELIDALDDRKRSLAMEVGSD